MNTFNINFIQISTCCLLYINHNAVIDFKNIVAILFVITFYLIILYYTNVFYRKYELLDDRMQNLEGVMMDAIHDLKNPIIANRYKIKKFIEDNYAQNKKLEEIENFQLKSIRDSKISDSESVNINKQNNDHNSYEKIESIDNISEESITPVLLKSSQSLSFPITVSPQKLIFESLFYELQAMDYKLENFKLFYHQYNDNEVKYYNKYVNLSQLCEKILKDMTYTLSRSNNKITFVKNKYVAHYCYIKEEVLSKIIYNLINNALVYTYKNQIFVIFDKYETENDLYSKYDLNKSKLYYNHESYILSVEIVNYGNPIDEITQDEIQKILDDQNIFKNTRNLNLMVSNYLKNSINAQIAFYSNIKETRFIIYYEYNDIDKYTEYLDNIMIVSSTDYREDAKKLDYLSDPEIQIYSDYRDIKLGRNIRLNQLIKEYDGTIKNSGDSLYIDKIELKPLVNYKHICNALILVEDNLSVMQMNEELCNQIELEYLKFFNGKEAKDYIEWEMTVNMCKLCKYIHVLSDRIMPILDGIELFQWLRYKKYLGRVKFAIISANDAVEIEGSREATPKLVQYIKPLTTVTLKKIKKIFDF